MRLLLKRVRFFLLLFLLPLPIFPEIDVSNKVPSLIENVLKNKQHKICRTNNTEDTFVTEIKKTKSIVDQYKKNFARICPILKSSIERYGNEYQTFSDSRSCPACIFSSVPSAYCNVLVKDKLCVQGDAIVQGDLTVCGTINGGTGVAGCPLFGNVVRVDKVFGNDITGQRNGCPFLTINAALNAALPGDTVWIFPGVYEESIIIPSGISVRGLSRSNVIIQQSNVTQNTDLVVMGENVVLEDLVLRLTSSQHVQLRGVVFPGTTTFTSQIRMSSILVDNSNAGVGNSDVCGVHASGSAVLFDDTTTLLNCDIEVVSTGAGSKRGILVDSLNNNLHINTSKIRAIGGTDCIGIETNALSARCAARYCVVFGDTADISQMAGVISLLQSELFHSQANGLGFDVEIAPGTILWADAGSLPAGINYMRPGTASVSPYEIKIRASQRMLIKSLSVRAQFPPGNGITDTWTVVRNGVDTPLTVTLTGLQNTNINNSISVHYDLGDDISLKLNRAPTSGTLDIIAIMDIY